MNNRIWDITLALASIAILSCLTSCSNTKPEEKNLEYWGVKVVKTEKLYYSNGELSRVLHFINENSLDGFWDSYTVHGDLARTELYLNSKVDTSWYWVNGQPTYQQYSADYSELIGYAHDSLQLKEYVQMQIEGK